MRSAALPRCPERLNPLCPRAPTSTVQIYAMRQKERAPKDASHIEMDAKSMHKTPEAAAQEAAAESRAQEARKVDLKLHTKRKAAHVSTACCCHLVTCGARVRLVGLPLHGSLTAERVGSSWPSFTNACLQRTS